MLTLNQIKKKLIQFFDNHKQINQVVYSNEFDFAAERKLKYPVVNIDYRESSLQDKTTTHIFIIKLGDKIIIDNPSSEDEIYSDMLQVAEDMYTYLWEDLSFNVVKSTSLQPFSDDNGDRVSGVVFRLNLTVIRPENRCVIPMD